MTAQLAARAAAGACWSGSAPARWRWSSSPPSPGRWFVEPARPGHRHAHRRRRDRAADLPAAAGRAGRAHHGWRSGRADRRRRRAARRAAGAAAPARPPGRRRPAPPTARTEGTRRRAPAPRPAAAAAGRVARAAARPARTRTFWLLAGGFAICGATTNGLIGTHFIPAAHDHGMPETTAAGLLALVGVFDIVGTIASGLAHRPVRPADPARRLLRAARRVAAGRCRRCFAATRTRACWSSSSSTGWTGWPPCRRPSRCAAQHFGDRRARSCSAGCSPRTRSARRSRPPRAGLVRDH